jgi:hypothetical protein
MVENSERMSGPEAWELLDADAKPIPITEEWLRDVGFKWHQFDRQPAKQWLLWLGDAIEDRSVCYEDLGIEVAPAVSDGRWFCWIRSDFSHRYSRFLHVRHIQYRHEIGALFEGLTGQRWDPATHFYGSAHTFARAQRIREEQDRIDLRLMRGEKWREIEKDDTRGGALPEHMEVAEKVRKI